MFLLLREAQKADIEIFTYFITVVETKDHFTYCWLLCFNRFSDDSLLIIANECPG
ncbi:MAG: hypothetical protein JWQ09_2495 [Segetibacter sp.]|nr:hypothetical protein [Segetibacter sp.]